jgi:hypothetical protein
MSGEFVMSPALQLKGKVAVSRQVTVNGIEVAASRKAQEEETSHHSIPFANQWRHFEEGQRFDDADPQLVADRLVWSNFLNDVHMQQKRTFCPPHMPHGGQMCLFIMAVVEGLSI